jgi:hypothetical protein
MGQLHSNMLLLQKRLEISQKLEMDALINALDNQTM